MLKWKINNNVISELYYNNQNIIKPWGFETADSSAFFSLEKNVGWRYKKLEEDYHFTDSKYEATVLTQMKEGKWELSIDEYILNETIIRKVEAKTLEDSFFMDFVMRYRFKKNIVEYAKIADKTIYHNDTNVYYQYPVDNILLKCKGFDIKLNILDKIVPENMEPVMYVRDNYDEWVVHVRMVPRKWDKEVIKICTSWAVTRPIPQFLSNFLLSFKKIKYELWYRGERKPFKNWLVRKFLNPAAFGMVKVKENTTLKWKVKMEIICDKK